MTSHAHYIAKLLQSCTDKKAHLSAKLLHANILRNGLFTDTLLFNRLVELYFKCNDAVSAHKLFDRMPQRNIYSWNTVLTHYCKVGHPENAYRFFYEKMPERNVASWNNLISALVRGGLEQKALDVFQDMILEGFVATHCTLASVLSACRTLLDVECGRRCHVLAIKVGLERNLYVCNALLSVYAKCGMVGDAVQVFEDVPDPNEITFTAMIGGLVQRDSVLEALDMFRLMRRKCVCIDSVSLSSVLVACGRHSGFDDLSDVPLRNVHGKQIHGLAIKLGFGNDLHLGNSLLDMYVKNGDMDSAEEVFANLPEVSVVSWNVMIAGYGQKYQGDKAMEYLRNMQSFGFEPDDVTFINLLKACVKSADMETLRQIFNCMACPSVSSWNAILSGYLQIENHKEVIKLFREMQLQNIQPNSTTLAIVLSSCAGMRLLDAGKQVHAASQKAAFHSDIYVASGLIGMYSKCNKMNTAECIFEKIPELDIVCWNSMIAGFSLNSLDNKAFTLFKQMRQNEMSATQFSYATIVSCCAKLSSSFQGRQVHALIAKEGFMNDVFVGSALIDMYCKCGDVDEAKRFFDMMPSKTTVTWNEMIHGYAQNGCGEEAVCLYRDMIGSGEKPDDVTFVAVLTACSHTGLVDIGVEIFDSMQRDHGVEPLLDHYTCIIDVLGRGGRFNEAEALVDKMPFKDDPVVWEVLLSSCRVHCNLNLGKKAAEELFRLDPENSVPYVLLGNIYTSLGRWDEARAVRELMTGREVVKDRGYSWIEHKGGLQYLAVDEKLRMVND